MMMAGLKAAAARLHNMAARLRGTAQKTHWDWLGEHTTADLFVEPSAEDFDVCRQIAKTYRPIITAYGIPDREFDDGSIKDHDAAALHALIRHRQPEIGYQVGTFVGYSAMILASAMKANGRGRLIACDPEIPHRSLMNPVDIARDAAATLELDGVISFVRGWNAVTMGDGYSQDFLRSIPVTGRATLAAVPAGIDFAFIDGDHSASATTCDLMLVQEFLKPDGIAVFHDVRSWPTVARALRSFIEDSFFYHAGLETFCDWDILEGADGLLALHCKAKSCYPLLKLTVRSAATGKPVPKAHVRVLETGYEAITGGDGCVFHFGEVSNQAQIVVTAPDFETWNRTGGVATDHAFRTLTIRLDPLDK